MKVTAAPSPLPFSLPARPHPGACASAASWSTAPTTIAATRLDQRRWLARCQAARHRGRGLCARPAASAAPTMRSDFNWNRRPGALMRYR